MGLGWRGGSFGVALAVVLVCGAVGAQATQAVGAGPAASTDSALTADALPTVQINGVVWAQTTIGNTVYATGSFTAARPAGAAPGTEESPALNVLAFDIRTGERVASFQASLNAQGRAIQGSPDGSRVYIGGDFTEVNGVARSRFVALDATTGALVSTFVPKVSGSVTAIAVTDRAVYIGGAFMSVNGSSRTRLAALSAAGDVLPWTPSADDHSVLSMVASPDQTRIIVGGRFTTLNGVEAKGLGALDPVTGQVQSFAANRKIHNSGLNAGITSLTTDGRRIYGSGYAFGTGGLLEGAFAADPGSGAIVWIEDCHGDTYGTFPIAGSLITVGHAHYCNNIGAFPESTAGGRVWARSMSFSSEPTQVIDKEQMKYFDWSGNPAPSAQDFWPALAPGTFTGQAQAAWSVTGGSGYVSLGGEFPTVNGMAQEGLVRFATRANAPNRMGPLWDESLRPVLIPSASGEVRVHWRSTWDRDDRSLTYRLIRDEARAQPVYEATTQSSSWDRPGMGFTDTGLTPGGTYKYRIVVVDGDGNTTTGYSAAITLPLTGEPSETPYEAAVRADGAMNYWRLGVGSGEPVSDETGGSWLTLGEGVGAGEAGAIAGEAQRASGFNGSNSALGYPQDRIAAPGSFSLEAWIRTTSTSGGRIVGFSDRQTGDSAPNYSDRILYVGTDGRVRLGINPPGDRRTIASPEAVNDGQWHHVVGGMNSTAGLSLYVDGSLVATDPAEVDHRFYSGYWRLGADNLAEWPGAGPQQSLTGVIDDVAVYADALTAAQVQAHWTSSGFVSARVMPERCGTTLKIEFRVAGTVPEGDGRVRVDGDVVGSWSAATGLSLTQLDLSAFVPAGSRTYELALEANGIVALPSTTIPMSCDADVPGPVRAVSAVPGDGTAQVSWDVPQWDGNSPITGYEVLASPGGARCTATGLTCTVKGLTNGTPYTFMVRARNVVGAGAPSEPSDAVVPRIPVRVKASKSGFGNVLLADVDPDRGSGGYSLTVERDNGDGTWSALASNYVTKGLAATAGIVLEEGTFRVVVPEQGAYARAVSAPVTLTQPTVRVSVARVRYGDSLKVNVDPGLGAGHWDFHVEQRTPQGDWTSLTTIYETQGAAETRTISLGPGVFRVAVTGNSAYQGSTSAEVELTKKTARVSVATNRARTRFTVDVDPGRGSGYWSFRVQQRRSTGEWITLPRSYRTRGRAETRIVDLGPGTYRVAVNAKYGYLGATSASVTLVG